MRGRAVLHADLDAFFVAAELRRRPELRGRPVIVAGRGLRAVVSSASYEARRSGVRSGMALAEARRRCPEAVVLPVDPGYYRSLAAQFRSIVQDVSDRVEILSIDEACLELGKAVVWPTEVREACEVIRARVRTELGLTVTIGAASGRIIAKVAAESAKPDGCRLVLPGQEASFLAPLPVESLPGIGPRAGRALRERGIATLGALAQTPLEVLLPIFGRRSAEIRALAAGRDEQPVGLVPRRPKSLGHEETFDEDLWNEQGIRCAVAELAEETARALRDRRLQARIVTVKVRFDDFATMTRQRALPVPTADGAVIAAVAWELAREIVRRRARPVRLVGVRVSDLSERALQLPLDLERSDDPVRRERFLQVLDSLARRNLPVRPGWIVRVRDER